MKESVRAKANSMKKINDLTLPGEIVIFGSTYMAGFPIYELVNKCTFENAVYNRSINGLTIEEALEIADDCVINIRPSKIFLSLGEEDEYGTDTIENYAALVSKILFGLPGCELYIIGLTGNVPHAEVFNKSLMDICDGKRVKYVSFITKNISETALYKIRFRQLSRFFRNSSMSLYDVFSAIE
ncbi:MAG: hypothetical protein IKT70_08375 [Clostridia bacterium]|nr:hypothetical protein [Clostridia bacterium]